MIKKFIFALMLIPSLAFGQSADSEEGDVLVFINPDHLKYETKDQVVNDVYNRFVLGAFGVDALVVSLPPNTPESVKSEIRAMNASDVESNSTPFSSFLSYYSKPSFGIFHLFSLAVFILFFVWTIVQSLFITQFSGEFLGKNLNKGLTSVKAIVIMSLIIPNLGMNSENEKGGLQSFYGFSAAQHLVFKLMGISNLVGTNIYSDFVNRAPITYPVVKLPPPSSRNDFGIEVLRFANCVSTRTGIDPESEYHFNLIHKDSVGGLLNGEVKIEECRLSVDVGFDESVLETIKGSDSLSQVFPNYNQIQEKAISGALQKVFDNAFKYVDTINEAYSNMNMVNYDLDLGGYERAGIEDAEFVYSQCDNLSGIFSGNLKTKTMLSDFIYRASSCLSKDLISYLSYPAGKTDFLEYNYKSNYLKDFNVELCAHDYSGDPAVRSFAAGESFNAGGNDRFEDVNSCVRKECSGVLSSSSYSGLYLCSNAINLSAYLENHSYIGESGWLLAGGNIYRLMASYKPSGSAKSVLNLASAQFDYDESDDPDLYNVTSTDGVSVKLNLRTLNSSYDFENASEIYNESKDYLNEGTWEFISDGGKLSDILNLGDNGELGPLGLYKFMHCITRPNRISNGYACGFMMEELREVGDSMFSTGVQLYTLSFIANKAKAFSKSKSKDTSGSISALPGVDNNVKRVIGLKTIMGMLNSFYSGSSSDIDIFSNHKKFNEVTRSVTVSAIIATTLMSSDLAKEIGSFVLFLTFLGFVALVIIPLIPLVYWISAIISFFVAYFVALILLPLTLATLLSPNASSSFQGLKSSIILILNLFIRGPLLIAGLIFAWMLSNIFIGEFVLLIGFESALSIESSGLIKSLLEYIVVVFIYFILIYVIYGLIFSMVEGFYEVASSWMFGNKDVSPYGKNRADKWGGYKDYAKFG